MVHETQGADGEPGRRAAVALGAPGDPLQHVPVAPLMLSPAMASASGRTPLIVSAGRRARRGRSCKVTHAPHPH